VLEVLERVVVPLANEDEMDALDQLTEALVEPGLLHHASKRLQGLVLACLQQALRIHRLDDDYNDDHRPSSPPPHRPHDKPEEAGKGPAERSLTVHCGASSEGEAAHHPAGQGRLPTEKWLTAGGELCALIRCAKAGAKRRCCWESDDIV
jgi:hypothetical protein